MSTSRQRSFIGALWLQGCPLNTLEAHLGKPAWANRLPPGLALAPHLASTVRNDSHLLSCQAGGRGDALPLYFHWMGSGYHLYVRSPGARFGQPVLIDQGRYLALSAGKGQTPAVLRLGQPGGQAEAEEHLIDSGHPLALTCNGLALGKARRAYSAYEYLAAKREAPAAWRLDIYERGISPPWLSAHNER